MSLILFDEIKPHNNDFYWFGNLYGRPSTLLTLAITDLIQCENNPDIRICMEDWLAAEEDRCRVCMAGAVMYQTLGKRVSEEIPVYYPDHLEECPALIAIDYLRSGSILSAFNVLLTPFPRGTFRHNVDIANYRLNPILFKQQIQKMINELAQRGY